jgi:catechol 2,3-dioxygenase-like lactoylglutathione lyase family enzyme
VAREQEHRAPDPNRAARLSGRVEALMNVGRSTVCALVAGAAVGFLLGSAGYGQRVSGQSADYFEGSSVAHVGIVVRDADKAAKLWGEVFGVQVEPARPPTLLEFPTPVATPGKVKIRGFTKANFRFELIEPLEGSSPHRDFLNTRGEGVQHFSFGTVNDLDGTVRMLQSKGGKYTLGNEKAGYAYVDMPAPFGFTIEVAPKKGGRVSAPRN